MSGLKHITALSTALWLTGIGPLGAQNASDWARAGLIWEPIVIPEPVVDQQRVLNQIQEGCGATKIAYGDIATMRDYRPNADWPNAVRRLSAAAAFVDNPVVAQDYLRQARGTAGLSGDMVEILENQSILTALQFQDTAMAMRFLDQFGTDDALPGPILSDRLFWSVIAQSSAPTATWRTVLMPGLDSALAADPSSFQVRVWRVLGWLSTRNWESESCAQNVKAFSDIVLDLSDAGACPVMIAHFSHGAARFFGPLKHRNPSDPVFGWKAFGDGLLSFVSGNDATLSQSITEFSSPGAPYQCASLFAAELSSLRNAR